LIDIEYNKEYYEALIEGCDVDSLNLKDGDGLTALHITASLGNTVKALMKKN